MTSVPAAGAGVHARCSGCDQRGPGPQGPLRLRSAGPTGSACPAAAARRSERAPRAEAASRLAGPPHQSVHLVRSPVQARVRSGQGTRRSRVDVRHQVPQPRGQQVELADRPGRAVRAVGQAVPRLRGAPGPFLLLGPVAHHRESAYSPVAFATLSNAVMACMSWRRACSRMSISSASTRRVDPPIKALIRPCWTVKRFVWTSSPRPVLVASDWKSASSPRSCPSMEAIGGLSLVGRRRRLRRRRSLRGGCCTVPAPRRPA